MTLRIVRGEPTAEELAALTALMTAGASGTAGVSGATGVADGPAQAPHGRWNDPARRLQAPPQPGAGAWRASLR